MTRINVGGMDHIIEQDCPICGGTLQFDDVMTGRQETFCEGCENFFELKTKDGEFVRIKKVG